MQIMQSMPLHHVRNVCVDMDVAVQLECNVICHYTLPQSNLPVSLIHGGNDLRR
jgi:hypothetical protein